MLGVSWNPATDKFQFTVNCLNEENVWTKRKVLSQIAKNYDPLGWLSPANVTAKIFMHKLWLDKIGWDTPLPVIDKKYWLSWYSRLNSLSLIEIPRWCGYTDGAEYKLFGFADASKKAYSAVIYLRIRRDFEINVNM